MKQPFNKSYDFTIYTQLYAMLIIAWAQP